VATRIAAFRVSAFRVSGCRVKTTCIGNAHVEEQGLNKKLGRSAGPCLVRTRRLQPRLVMEVVTER
jgi:hypothetical protein